jgi:hypothetical protein
MLSPSSVPTPLVKAAIISIILERAAHLAHVWSAAFLYLLVPPSLHGPQGSGADTKPPMG